MRGVKSVRAIKLLDLVIREILYIKVAETYHGIDWVDITVSKVEIKNQLYGNRLKYLIIYSSINSL